MAHVEDITAILVFIELSLIIDTKLTIMAEKTRFSKV